MRPSLMQYDPIWCCWRPENRLEYADYLAQMNEQADEILSPKPGPPAVPLQEKKPIPPVKVSEPMKEVKLRPVRELEPKRISKNADFEAEDAFDWKSSASEQEEEDQEEPKKRKDKKKSGSMSPVKRNTKKLKK